MIAAIVILILSGCREQVTQEPVSEITHEGDIVTLTKAQYDRAGITTGKLIKRKLTENIDARGIVDVKPDGIAAVSTIVEGIVKEIFVDPGEKINRDDLLCRLTHPSIIEVQQKYLESLYNLELASSSYERAKELKKENISSEKAFQKAEAEYLLARSASQASKTRLEMLGIDPEMASRGEVRDYVDIKSPISGRVNKINARLGSYTEISEELFEIVDTDKLILELKIFESDIPLIKPGQKVIFTLSNLDETPHHATVVSISGIMEKGARVLLVLAEITGGIPEAYPGMFCAASIKVNESEVLSVPASAILEEGDGITSLFILIEERDDVYYFQKVGAEAGVRDENLVEIIPGENIGQDSEIVTSGVYYLKSELIKQLD